MELSYSELQDRFDAMTEEERKKLASKDCHCGGYGLQAVEDDNKNEVVAYCDCLVDGLIEKGEV